MSENDDVKNVIERSIHLWESGIERRPVVCLNRHLVDDDDGLARYAEVGSKGQARWTGLDTATAFEIIWDSGAWGFYDLEDAGKVFDFVKE